MDLSVLVMDMGRLSSRVLVLNNRFGAASGCEDRLDCLREVSSLRGRVGDYVDMLRVVLSSAEGVCEDLERLESDVHESLCGSLRGVVGDGGVGC